MNSRRETVGEVKNKDGEVMGYYHDIEPDGRKIEDVFRAIPTTPIFPEKWEEDKWQETVEDAKFENATMDDVERCFSDRYPSTPAELYGYAIGFFRKCIKICRAKNARYAGSKDPFRNFRMGGQYGIAIRMGDKVSRLTTLLEPGNVADVGDESIDDTCNDLANYAMLLVALRANERGSSGK
jgi:hypothetical protein